MLSVSSQASGIVSGVQKSGVGSASLAVTGRYAGATDRVCLIQIDTTTGAQIGQATYRWRFLDMAAGEWGGSGIVTHAVAQPLQDGATLRFISGGSGADFASGDEWQFRVIAAWGAKNLLDLRRDTAYRSGFLEAPNTVTVDFGVATRITAFCLFDHNLTANATVTLMMNASNAWTAPAFSQALAVSAPIIVYLDQSYRYLRIALTDAANPDGQIRIGLMYAGDYMQLEANADWGASETLLFNQASSSNAAGVTQDAIFTEQTELSLSFTGISNAEIDQLAAMFRAINLPGTRQLRPVFFHLFCDAPSSLKLMRLDPSLRRSYNGYLLNDTSIALKEVVASRW